MNAVAPRVLLVEDEPQIRHFVRQALEAEGLQIHEAATGKQGMSEAATRPPDLMILDLGLPDMDGVSLIRDLRNWSALPILILSARDAEQDKIDALDAGADDYLTKPFGIGELLARVRALLRRRMSAAEIGPLVEFGTVTVDFSRRSVSRSGDAVHLTPIEYRLLAVLITNAGKVMTHRHLLREVWGPSYAESSHYLRVYVGNLRRKLEDDPAQPRHFLTETGVGYRFPNLKEISMSEQRSSTRVLALAALGVVYGDIGTSPLYTMHEVFAGSHHSVPITPDNVLGILSLIFWSLMIVVTIKYVGFILSADNKGEGGIMALMALALRPTEAGSRRQKVIVILGLFGAALFYGDGVITPAISVLSAVEGLEVATPAFKPYIIPITIAVLVGLFVIQRKGTGSVGALFGPITAVWFAALALLGGINIVDHPAVLLALDPRHGMAFFLTQPALAFFSLGAVVLAVTGTEALYADMGHFGRKPIQLAWLALVLPALVLNYFGQGALLLADATAIENPFYRLAPDWALYPLVALATIATVIASQAVISGAFSLTQQAIQMGYSPRLQVRHTSDREMGQIYLPGINWALLIAIIALVLGFRSSTNLAAAYGIAVTGTMAITSILAFCVARWLWGWPLWRAAFGALPFLMIDFVFFAANAVKIFDGGWFPLALGLMMFVLLTTWKQGRSLLYQRLEAEAIPVTAFIKGCGVDSVTRVSGTAVFLTTNAEGVPHALLHSLKHYKTLHERVVLVTAKVLDVPRVQAPHRVKVENLSNDFWRVNVFYGFMDEPDLPTALDWCAEQGLNLDMFDTTFFLGRETLIPKLKSDMAFWREVLFVNMFRNAGSAAAYFKLPPNRVVELGTQVVL